MRKLILAIAALFFSAASFAVNTITEVEQVTESVTLTADVDYVITSTTPIATSGSVNIRNTEHAVLIFKHIKPSKVIANHLGAVFINGEKAVNGVNCQVKMYAQGTIVLPYGDGFKPLTCYSEENYGGESCNNYGLGNTGGYMNTLTAAQLNNNIRSFKLKRGYMATFAVGVSGWGYSRCFIADREDLEIAAVPAPLNGKISSYRIFKWQDAQKKGLASDTRFEPNDALNTSWCYDWALGNNRLPDQETVPNHIYEDWPSSASCGSVNYSAHMKTNNEPGNSADDHPQTVDEVLNNWQNLMRTGMRLCSESSHDGSMNHLKAFIDSIDARGWRCDILDLHCYWPSGSFNNLTWYSDYYGNGRPIWVSEWVWGASWNNNGIFASGYDRNDFWSSVNQEANYNGVVPILQVMNANSRVERYAYWNSEADCSKIYKDGNLSKLGKYYAEMESGLAYNPANEFVPKIVYKNPGALILNYTKKTNHVQLTWEDANGDMIDSIIVECKRPGTTRYTTIATIPVKDQDSKAGSTYTFSETLQEVGLHTYRVTEYYDAKRKTFRTNEEGVTVAAALNVGSLQYGRLNILNTDLVTTDIVAQDVAPYVVTGLMSNRNAANGITGRLRSLSKSSFGFNLLPWAYPTAVEIKTAEQMDYLILPADTILELSDGFMLMSQKAGYVKGDVVEITFPKAFPEGVVPVVVAQQNTALTSYPPVVVRVFDVTNTGFKVVLTKQEAETSTLRNHNVNYFAASPGQISLGEGKMLTVGRDNTNAIGGVSRKNIYFNDLQGNSLSFQNPYIIAAPQTYNYAPTALFRQHANVVNETGGVYGITLRRQIDGTTTDDTGNSASTNGDYMGWFVISDDPNGNLEDLPVIVPTGIHTVAHTSMAVTISGRVVYSDNQSLRLYDSTGRQMPFGRSLPAGIYVLSNGMQSQKVVLK